MVNAKSMEMLFVLDYYFFGPVLEVWQKKSPFQIRPHSIWHLLPILKWVWIEAGSPYGPVDFCHPGWSSLITRCIGHQAILQHSKHELAMLLASSFDSGKCGEAEST